MSLCLGIHRYTVAAQGIKLKTKVFSTRYEANGYMYELMGRYNLTLSNVYDDKHFKTYIFTNGIRIYINRE